MAHSLAKPSRLQLDYRVALHPGEPAHWTHRRDTPIMKESAMEPMSISEFVRRSRLAPKALRP
jgi:hypothetical protein